MTHTRRSFFRWTAGAAPVAAARGWEARAAGTGWPSFTQPVAEDNVGSKKEVNHG